MEANNYHQNHILCHRRAPKPIRRFVMLLLRMNNKLKNCPINSAIAIFDRRGKKRNFWLPVNEHSTFHVRSKTYFFIYCRCKRACLYTQIIFFRRDLIVIGCHRDTLSLSHPLEKVFFLPFRDLPLQIPIRPFSKWPDKWGTVSPKALAAQRKANRHETASLPCQKESCFHEPKNPRPRV